MYNINLFVDTLSFPYWIFLISSAKSCEPVHAALMWWSTTPEILWTQTCSTRLKSHSRSHVLYHKNTQQHTRPRSIVSHNHYPTKNSQTCPINLNCSDCKFTLLDRRTWTEGTMNAAYKWKCVKDRDKRFVKMNECWGHTLKLCLTNNTVCTMAHQ